MARVVERLVIVGRLGDPGFEAWIAERAGRLSLAGGVRRVSPERIEVIAEGPDALLDAMDLACSLGPAGVLVDRIEREPLPALPRHLAPEGKNCPIFRHLP